MNSYARMEENDGALPNRRFPSQPGYEQASNSNRRDVPSTMSDPLSRPSDETANVDAWKDNDTAANGNTTKQFELSFMPRNQLAAIRLALGLLLAVLVVAALATVAACRQYRLVVATFWVILLMAFVGLAQLLQYSIQRNDNILPPLVRRMVHAAATEMEHFRQDWREQVLLLKNEPEEAEMGTQQQQVQDGSNLSNANQPRRRARSRVFRVFVQPFVPLLTRRKRRRQQEEEDTIV